MLQPSIIDIIAPTNWQIGTHSSNFAAAAGPEALKREYVGRVNEGKPGDYVQRRSATRRMIESGGAIGGLSAGTVSARGRIARFVTQMYRSVSRRSGRSSSTCWRRSAV